MKKVVALVFAFSLTIIFTLAEDELIVRFHSIGHNATIDLERYLGKSDAYYSTSSENVSIKIENATAFLVARPGWTGVEMIRFTTKYFLINQSNISMLKEYAALPEELKGKLPVAPPDTLEGLYRQLTIEEVKAVVSDTLAPASVWESLPREEIRGLKTTIKGSELIVNVNDIDILVNLAGYKPSVVLNLSCCPPSGGVVVAPEKRPFNYSYLLVLPVVILVAVLLFRIRKPAKQVMDENLRKATLQRLTRLKRSMGEDANTKFLDILKDFFSSYFRISGFTFRKLLEEVGRSDIKDEQKKELKGLITEVTKRAFCMHSEQWFKVYDRCKIPEKELKVFIGETIKVIKKL